MSHRGFIARYELMRHVTSDRRGTHPGVEGMQYGVKLGARYERTS
jgi:hypothetical protein